MKIGFKLRRISIKLIDITRQFRECYYYFKDYFYENSFKKAKPSKIKSLLIIQEGAIGDTYNLIGVLNKLSENYPNIKIYCLTREKDKKFYKNPKINVIAPEKAEELINERKIDALISNSSIGHFFKNKSIVFNIPYRSGKLFPYKTRNFSKGTFPIFRKLGFKINDLKFYFTKEGEATAKIFYKEKNLKKPLIFLQVGSAKTLRAMKEGLIQQMWPFLWPPENWARVADYLVEKYNGTIIFIGVKEEKPLIREVIQKVKHKNNIFDVAGKFSIEETASIVKGGDLIVGIDSGIIHILSQIGIPTLVLISGDPKISSPHKSINVWNPKVCNSCRKYFCPEKNPVCITKITVEQILNNLPKLR